MADTIADINVPYDEYINLNTVSGIAVGTAMEILIKGSEGLFIQEGETQPDSSSTDGRSLDGKGRTNGYVSCYIKSGSGNIWIRSSGYNRSSRINVQED